MYIDLVVFLVGNAKQKWTPLTNPWDSAGWRCSLFVLAAKVCVLGTFGTKAVR